MDCARQQRQGRVPGQEGAGAALPVSGATEGIREGSGRPPRQDAGCERSSGWASRNLIRNVVSPAAISALKTVPWTFLAGIRNQGKRRHCILKIAGNVSSVKRSGP